MTKFIAFATATAALFTATAATARDADTTKIDGDRRVIDGRAYPAGNGFHLVVRGDEVSGTSGGVPVKFRVASARGAAVETATR